MNPDWKVATMLSGFSKVEITVEVCDWDTSGDDHYDCTGAGKDPKFFFDHGGGVWEETTNSWTVKKYLRSFNTFPEGMTYGSQGNGSENFANVVQKLMAAKIP